VQFFPIGFFVALKGPMVGSHQRVHPVDGTAFAGSVRHKLDFLSLSSENNSKLRAQNPEQIHQAQTNKIKKTPPLSGGRLILLNHTLNPGTGQLATDIGGGGSVRGYPVLLTIPASLPGFLKKIDNPALFWIMILGIT
jgi:hypothetical protein